MPQGKGTMVRENIEDPQMWVWPQVPLEGPPPPPPPTPPPPHALQKEPRGVGGRGRERAGREGLWLEGRGLQLQWGMGGGPSKHQLGPDPHLGAPKNIVGIHDLLLESGRHREGRWGVSSWGVSNS